MRASRLVPQPICLLNVVGLTARSVGVHTPHLAAIAGASRAQPLAGVIPGVTCSAQATMLTGELPARHGIVGNGWFWRETGEVRFWLRSNRLIDAETVYAAARRIAADRGETRCVDADETGG